MEAEIERTTVTHHGVQDGHQLAHAGDPGHLLQFVRREQALVEGLYDGIVVASPSGPRYAGPGAKESGRWPCEGETKPYPRVAGERRYAGLVCLSLKASSSPGFQLSPSVTGKNLSPQFLDFLGSRGETVLVMGGLSHACLTLEDPRRKSQPTLDDPGLAR